MVLKKWFIKQVNLPSCRSIVDLYTMILWKNYSAMKRDLQHWVSIWSYGVLALMFFFLPEFTQVFLRLLFFLIVKDISVYAIDLSWWIKIKQTDIAKINTLYTQKKVTTAYFLSLINRIYSSNHLKRSFFGLQARRRSKIWNVRWI